MGEEEKKEVIIEDEDAVKDGKSMAWLSYLGILLLIPLLVKQDNAFCKHHAKQGLVFLIIWVGLMIINVIPVIGWIISLIGSIILLVMAIMGIVKSLQGKYWKAPMNLYELSQKFTF